MDTVNTAIEQLANEVVANAEIPTVKKKKIDWVNVAKGTALVAVAMSVGAGIAYYLKG